MLNGHCNAKDAEVLSQWSRTLNGIASANLMIWCQNDSKNKHSKTNQADRKSIKHFTGQTLGTTTCDKWTEKQLQYHLHGLITKQIAPLLKFPLTQHNAKVFYFSWGWSCKDVRRHCCGLVWKSIKLDSNPQPKWSLGPWLWQDDFFFIIRALGIYGSH